MSTTNERIKKLRKALDLTQEAFGKRIGVKRNTVATYELGRNKPVDSVVSLICREFNVNEEWLRTGTGEMFNPAPLDALDELIKQYGLPSEIRTMVEKFIALKPEAQRVVIDYVRDVAAALNAETRSDAPPLDQHAIWEAEARAEAEQIYREILEEKKAAAESSAFPPGGDRLA